LLKPQDLWKCEEPKHQRLKLRERLLKPVPGFSFQQAVLDLYAQVWTARRPELRLQPAAQLHFVRARDHLGLCGDGGVADRSYHSLDWARQVLAD
jgi:hypothetical protein